MPMKIYLFIYLNAALSHAVQVVFACWDQVVYTKCDGDS